LALPHQLLDSTRRTIPNPNPNDLRRKSKNETSLEEVRILGDDNVIVVAGVLSDRFVRGVPQSNKPYMRRAGIHGLKKPEQAGR